MKTGAIFDSLLNILAYVGSGLIAVAFVIVTADVLLRTFLNSPLQWATEVTEYMQVFATFMAAAWLLEKEGHVVMDAITGQLSPKSRAALNAATSLVGAGICLIVTWFGLTNTLHHASEGTRMIEKTLGLSTAPLISIVPVGFFLLSVQFLRRSYNYLRKWRTITTEQLTRFDDGF